MCEFEQRTIWFGRIFVQSCPWTKMPAAEIWNCRSLIPAGYSLGGPSCFRMLLLLRPPSLTVIGVKGIVSQYLWPLVFSIKHLSLWLQIRLVRLLHLLSFSWIVPLQRICKIDSAVSRHRWVMTQYCPRQCNIATISENSLSFTKKIFVSEVMASGKMLVSPLCLDWCMENIGFVYPACLWW
jgi:hypothetical protein